VGGVPGGVPHPPGGVGGRGVVGGGGVPPRGGCPGEPKNPCFFGTFLIPPGGYPKRGIFDPPAGVLFYPLFYVLK